MPHDPTAAQSEASRVNGARSRGPATAAGRAALARASMRHGLTGAFHLLPDESRDGYERLLGQMLAAVAANDASTRAAVEAFAQATWRLERWRRLAAGSGAACAASPETLRRYRVRLEGEWRRASARLAGAHAEPEPARPLNRHQRRRAARLARYRKAA